MPRAKLPNKRIAITSTVHYQDPYAQGRGMLIDVTFGFIPDADGKYKLCEAFISSKSHVLSPLWNDICILISRLLQHGDTIESIAEGLGENRKEMETSGPPSSYIGAIARQGVTLEKDINEQ